jgi:hypothetical protein
MSFSCFRGLGIAVVVITLLSCVGATAWQGTGNMSSSNLTEIWSYINSTISTYAVVKDNNYFPDLTPFSVALSTHLESLWSPAWNVVTINSPPYSDTVVYGYAFNEHWMWYNSYEVNGFNLNFVIWKDYNCQNWQKVGEGNAFASGFTSSSFNDDLSSVVSQFTDRTVNIWKSASSFLTKLAATPSLSGNKAYSIVMSQDNDSTYFYGRVCMVSNNYLYTSLTDSQENSWGTYLFFQTR